VVHMATHSGLCRKNTFGAVKQGLYGAKNSLLRGSKYQYTASDAACFWLKKSLVFPPKAFLQAELKPAAPQRKALSFGKQPHKKVKKICEKRLHPR
jgi:hypothetical protein